MMYIQTEDLIKVNLPYLLLLMAFSVMSTARSARFCPSPDTVLPDVGVDTHTDDYTNNGGEATLVCLVQVRKTVKNRTRFAFFFLVADCSWDAVSGWEIFLEKRNKPE